MSKEFDKNAWRREVASNCLVALYGSVPEWESDELMSKAILLSVDALDKALEEAEKVEKAEKAYAETGAACTATWVGKNE